MSLLVCGWVGLALCLAGAGCQLQIAFMEPATNSPVPAGYQPSTSGSMPNDPASQVVLTHGPGSNGPSMSAPMPSAGPPSSVPAPIPGDLEMGPGHGMPPDAAAAPNGEGVPHELAMRSLPPYMVEPPDILLIDTIRMIPKPPYTVGPLDVLIIRVAEPLPNQPIDGTYTVAPDGAINLGYSYGFVRVVGLTLEEIERAIRLQLARVLKEPQVAVGLAQFRGVQLVRGEHLVRPDGTINLGSYGCVYVAGLTLMQVKVAIERHLSQYLLEPEVSVDVFGYNSKDFFIIIDGAGYGQQVYRFPITGNETVLRAMSLIQGLPAVASKKKIWVARPTPANHECVQILPVDWLAITQAGATATNYQIFPGDRIYIRSNPLIEIDNRLAQVLAPLERLLGFALLTGSTIQTFRNNGNNSGGVGFILR
jgi:polysaccharide export outer membrane protein